MDKSTTIELLDFVLESIRLIHRRFETITCGDDFLENDDGLDRLDAETIFDICANELDILEENIKQLKFLCVQ